MLERVVTKVRVRRALAVCVAFTIAMSTALLTSADAQPRSLRIVGRFTTTTFNGPSCQSPIDLCAEGTFSGSLNGPVTAIATSLVPTSQPGVFLGVADIIVHDRRGDLTCLETFVIDLAPGNDGAEGVICRFTGGTGRWTGVTGYFAGYGFTPPGEPSTGRYEGKLRIP